MQKTKTNIATLLFSIVTSGLATAQTAPQPSSPAQPSASSGQIETPSDVQNSGRPRDIDRYHVERVNLASDIPPYHSFYIWRTVTEAANGKSKPGASIPVYRWDERLEVMTPTAQMPVGTEIKLDIVRDYFYHNYFRVALGTDASGHEKEGWIDGSNITRDDNDPRTYKPVKDKKHLHFPKK